MGFYAGIGYLIRRDVPDDGYTTRDVHTTPKVVTDGSNGWGTVEIIGCPVGKHKGSVLQTRKPVDYV